MFRREFVKKDHNLRTINLYSLEVEEVVYDHLLKKNYIGLYSV